MKGPIVLGPKTEVLFESLILGVRATLEQESIATLRRGLSGNGFRGLDDPWEPHVTFGRSRSIIPDDLCGLRFDESFVAETISLVSSMRGQTGPSYHEICVRTLENGI
jgi:2'-5' RNA ligase